MTADVTSLTSRTDRVYGAPACAGIGHLEAQPGDGVCMYCGSKLDEEQR